MATKYILSKLDPKGACLVYGIHELGFCYH